MKLKKILSFLFFFILLLISFYLGTVIKDIPYLVLKKEVSLVEISNLILTLFVAIVLPYILSKTINDKRIEKDLLIKSCEKFSDEIHDLRKLAESFILSKKIKPSQVKKLILRLRNNDNMLNLLKENCLAYLNTKEIHSITDLLINNQREVWSNLTLNIRDNTPKLTETAYIAAEKIIYAYLGNISKLMMSINSS